jgi:hypothetical protein
MPVVIPDLEACGEAFDSAVIVLHQRALSSSRRRPVIR